MVTLRERLERYIRDIPDALLDTPICERSTDITLWVSHADIGPEAYFWLDQLDLALPMSGTPGLSAFHLKIDGLGTLFVRDWFEAVEPPPAPAPPRVRPCANPEVLRKELGR